MGYHDFPALFNLSAVKREMKKRFQSVLFTLMVTVSRFIQPIHDHVEDDWD